MPALLLALLATALAGPVHVITLQGGVDPGSAAHIVQAIEDAQAAGAEALVLELDTPGGLVTSAREIVQAELAAEVPVVVYVSPSGARAGSAGVFLTMAAHVAAMGPGTTIGAAHPVDMFGGGGEQQPADGAEEAGNGGGGGGIMEEKVLNDVLAWSRAIALERGRNAEWAAEAVEHSAAITAIEALQLDVIDLISPNLDTLLQDLDGRVVETAGGTRVLRTAQAEVVRVEMRMQHRVVHWLGDPNVLFALIGLGMLGLYVEFYNPGLIVPGVGGVALLLAAAVGMSMVPFNVGGLLLVVFAFGAFGLEAWVGAMGVLALVGAAALVLGGLLLFDVEGFDLTVDLIPLLGIALVISLIALAVGGLVAKAHRRPAHLGKEGLLQTPGTVLGGTGADGRVRIQGEEWRATWEGELAPGDPIKVRAVDGLVLRVEAE